MPELTYTFFVMAQQSFISFYEPTDQEKQRASLQACQIGLIHDLREINRYNGTHR